MSAEITVAIDQDRRGPRLRRSGRDCKAVRRHTARVPCSCKSNARERTTGARGGSKTYGPRFAPKQCFHCNARRKILVQHAEYDFADRHFDTMMRR